MSIQYFQVNTRHFYTKKDMVYMIYITYWGAANLQSRYAKYTFTTEGIKKRKPLSYCIKTCKNVLNWSKYVFKQIEYHLAN